MSRTTTQEPRPASRAKQQCQHKLSKLQDCEQFLQKENSLSPNSDRIIKKYLEVSDRGNLDDFLLVIPDKIRNDDYLHSILRYMRAHNQFDWSDHERIFSNVSFTTVERKATELLAVVAQKDAHAFWYLAHSFEAKQEPLYRHLHGPIQCCGKYFPFYQRSLDNAF